MLKLIMYSNELYAHLFKKTLIDVLFYKKNHLKESGNSFEK